MTARHISYSEKKYYITIYITILMTLLINHVQFVRH